MGTTLLRKPPAKGAFPQVAAPIAIIVLQGEYGFARREELVAKLEAIPICDIAIIDMREVTHIDPTALACFVQLRKRLQRDGPGIVRVVGLRPGLYRLYEAAYLHYVFDVFESIADAMGEYGYLINGRPGAPEN
jgi:anti-anti-sigma regulatory factor